jgi:adenine-specific DNA-methyltransferase
MNLSPVELSENHSLLKSDSSSKKLKKELGQYFTPRKISMFMAKLFAINKKRNTINILDPGCGTLLLSSSVIEHLINNYNSIKFINIYGFEIDEDLKKENKKIISKIKTWGKSKDVEIKYQIKYSDFLTEKCIKTSFDLIISNPPYFKVKKSDPRVRMVSKNLLGQQNIYGLFLMKSLENLSNDGQLIFIIPRSFTSGMYFETIREQLLKKLQFKQFHVFHSRKDSFSKDGVLQENIILHAEVKTDLPQNLIVISQTEGKSDFEKIITKSYVQSSIILPLGNMEVIHLPVNEEEEDAMRIFKNWNRKLKDYDLKVSTGPVVAYRAEKYIPKRKTKYSVPLLWLNNCTRFHTQWPLKLSDKSQWIKPNRVSDSKTVKNQNYVFIRRTGSKDDKHLVTASTNFKMDLDFGEIGIENHLNFLHKINGEIPDNTLLGLTAFFNSNLFEAFYRTVCGSTQINATDLNNISMPDLDTIQELGIKLKMVDITNLDLVNSIINDELKKEILVYG